MPTSQLDKLLLDYVLEGNDSFYSDKQLAEMKVVYDKVLKDLFPEEDPKEIERSNGEFLNMMSEEQARRKLEADAKARRVVVENKAHIPKSPVRFHVGNLAIQETAEGYCISNHSRSVELPPISLKQLREFAKYVLEAT